MIKIFTTKKMSITANKLKKRLKDIEGCINWGSSGVLNHNVLNNNITYALSKIKTFKQFSLFKIPCPEWTIKRSTMEEWWEQKFPFLVRKTISSFGGKGIIFIDPTNIKLADIPYAPLYVKYIKKTNEYRVHVFNAEVIDIQQKKIKKDFPKEKVNYQIRNHKNGWVFCRSNIYIPKGIKDLAIGAVNSLHLDFGAVDIIWNEKQNKLYVLEVNTAPGLTGTTLDKYVAAFTEQFPS
jgi:glutathione synthase/RimK-type ligase-like ATP-grasp enzyme